MDEEVKETPVETPSIDDTLGDVWDKLQEPVKDVAPIEEKTEEPVEEPSQDGRPRDEHGRFIKADGTPEEAPKPDETTEQPKVVASKTPPPSWSAQAKAEWAKLSPAIQDAVLKRESEASTGFKTYSDKVKALEPIERALQPYGHFLAANGIEPAEYVKRLANADHYLRTNPREAIQWIARTYGIQLDSLRETREEQPPADPHIAALEQQVNGIVSFIRETQQQAATRESQSLQSQVESFRTASNTDGSPKHPYFEEVRQDMAALVQSGRATTIEDAYDMAIYANRQVRERVLADQKAKDEAERKRVQEKRVADAKKAAGTNLSSRGAVAGSPAKSQSIDETIAQAYDRAVSAA